MSPQPSEKSTLESTDHQFLTDARVKVKRIANRLIRKHQARFDASDVAQEVMQSVVKNLEHLQTLVAAQHRSWFRTATQRAIKDLAEWHSSLKRDPGRESPRGPDTEGLFSISSSPEGQLARRELWQAVAAAESHMDDEERKVLHLWVFEELCPAEVARQLDKNVDQVRWIIKKCVSKLRRELGGPQGWI